MKKKLITVITFSILLLSGCGLPALKQELSQTSNIVEEIFIEENQESAADNASEQGNPDLQSFEAFTVSYVIDGDTFTIDDGTKTVRLIGIDTPESKASEEYTAKTGKENCEEGKIASEFTKDLLKKGTTVYLEYDAATEDAYGRTLAYVYFEDGRMLQDVLLENGMARIMTIQPNSKYADRFLKEQENARENSMGFWDTGFYKD